MKSNIYKCEVKKSDKIKQSLWFWVLKHAHEKKLKETALSDYPVSLISFFNTFWCVALELI